MPDPVHLATVRDYDKIKHTFERPSRDRTTQNKSKRSEHAVEVSPATRNVNDVPAVFPLAGWRLLFEWAQGRGANLGNLELRGGGLTADEARELGNVLSDFLKLLDETLVAAKQLAALCSERRAVTVSPPLKRLDG